MRTRKAVMVALFAGLVPLSVPAAPAEPTILFEKYTLPNGLEVILHEDHTVPTVYVEARYKVGSKDETPGKTGFAHLFEHVMFQGTKHVPEDKHFGFLQESGATGVNGSTNFDRTNYHETVPSNQVELALWLESERMGFLLERDSFKKTLDNQRDVVKNERRQRVENSPMGGVGRVRLEAVYPPDHPYYHEVIGSMDDLSAASEADIKSFFAQWYAPGNATLAIAGDFDKGTIKALVDKYFGPIPAGPKLTRLPVPPPVKIAGEKRIAMEAKVKLPTQSMTYVSVADLQPGDAELSVLASILAGGKTSRLYKRLVYEMKIAQSVSAGQSGSMIAGTFGISFSPLPGHTLAEIEKVVDEEVAKIRTMPVEQREIQRVKNQIEVGFFAGLEQVSARAARLLEYNYTTGDPGYLARDIARFRAVDAAGIQKWAQQILKKDARVVITVEPNPMAPIMGRLKVPPAQKAPPPRLAPGASKAMAVAPRTTPDADFRKEKPKPAGETAFKIPGIKRFKLKNGLSVLLAEDHDLPLVSFDLGIKTGGAANPKGMAGLADITANMLDEGTKTRPALQIAEDIAVLGASLSSGAGWDSSSLSVRTLTRNVDKALEIWADVLRNPAFDEKEFSRVRDNTLTGLIRRKDSPPAVAGLTLDRVLYGEDHPYGWPQNGTEETVKKLTVADCREFYESTYKPGNAILAVAGDITEADLKAKLEVLLKDWKPGKVAAVKLPKAAPQAKTKIFLVDKAGAPQSSIRVALVGIERKNPNYFPATVMNLILGGGFHRLGLSLREAKGWTYGVRSNFDMRRGPGPWAVSGEFVADKTAPSVEEILKEINAMRDADVGDDELRKAKDEIMKGFPARFATDNQIVQQYATMALHELPDNHLEQFVKKVDAITKADVRKMAKKYLLADKMAIVVVGDQKSNEEPLRKLGDVELRDLDGNPLKLAAKAAEASKPAAAN